MPTLENYTFADAVEYHYGRFPPNNLDYGKLIGPLRKAASAIARYDAVLNSLHNKDLLLAPIHRQEAVVSSRMEGTVATLDELLTYEAEDNLNEDALNRNRLYRKEILEVHSYVRALVYAQRQISEGLPLCNRLIKHTHGRLLFFGRGADKQPGNFKKDQNYIADNAKKKILFIPIGPSHLDGALQKFENFINEDTIDPLIRTAIAHIEFEALHPFKDGNGRVGRMLITLMLWQTGLISGPHFYISGNLEQKKEEYIDRMRAVSSHDAWTEWVIFFLEAAEKQAEDNLKVAEEVLALYEKMKEEFRMRLASQWTVNALDYIFSKPVFKNSDFTSKSGIPKATAIRFTKVLADDELLTTISPASGRRSAVYAFEPLLRIVRA